MMRRLLLLPLLALVVSGCGLTHFQSGAWNGGTGQVQVIAQAKRSAPITLSGTTLDGRAFDLASTRGKVTVINVWGSWCSDCIQEAAEIEDAHKRLGASVPFVGLDIRDYSRKNALAFERGNGVTYPSVYAPDATALLSLDAGLSVETIPATVILDRQGRVATVIRGKVPSTLTLVEAVQDVVHGTHGA